MIRNELKSNEAMRDVFEIQEKWDKDIQTEIIVNFKDGHRCRLLAKGAGQKIRGRNWENTRPDLIVVDDLEDDEAVESPERRRKLKDWFLKAVIPALSRRGIIRYIGTILHEGSLLNMTINSKAWYSRLYKAHKSFDDFSEILWPEMWPEERLREMRQSYIDSHDPEGYSQEFLNDPSDLANSFFRQEDFLPMDLRDHDKLKTYYIGADFALSDKNYSDYTAFVVGGYDEEGLLHIVEVVKLRTDDSNEIIIEMFNLMAKWKPEYFVWEKGILSNAIEPAFLIEMQRRNMFVHIETYPATADKRTRAYPIQQRMRAGAVRFDTEAQWYDGFRDELRKFPKSTRKDQTDAFAWLGIAINDFVEAPTEQELEDAEWEDALASSGLMTLAYDGTGY